MPKRPVETGAKKKLEKVDPYDDIGPSEEEQPYDDIGEPAGEVAAEGGPQPETPAKGHLVPATVIEQIDKAIDERKAREMAAGQYPHTPVEELPARNLQGVVYEGMVSRHLQETRGTGKVVEHPEGRKLEDGRPIEPDFEVQDEAGNPREIVDAKAYTRKPTENPQASAASLTHVQGLERTSRYATVDEPSVDRVTLAMPRETAGMPAVQEAVSEMGTKKRPVSVEAVGTEEDIKKRMEDLRAPQGGQPELSGRVKAEVARIQALPVEERRAAMGEFVLSLRDSKGDETTEGEGARIHSRIERNGDGITLIAADGTEHTVWYREGPASEAAQEEEKAQAATSEDEAPGTDSEGSGTEGQATVPTEDDE